MVDTNVSNLVATVMSVNDVAWIIGTDGQIKVLQVGDVIQLSDQVFNNGGVFLELQFTDGSIHSLNMQGPTLVQNIYQDVAQIQETILGGGDPTSVAEAPAAGVEAAPQAPLASGYSFTANPILDVNLTGFSSLSSLGQAFQAGHILDSSNSQLFGTIDLTSNFSSIISAPLTPSVGIASFPSPIFIIPVPPESPSFSSDTQPSDSTSSTPTPTPTPPPSSNNPAVITGDYAGAVVEDLNVDINGLIVVGGQLSVVDPDAGQSFFVPQSIHTTYGDYVLTSTGDWSYSVDNALIQSFGAGYSVNESFSVVSVDGTVGQSVVVS